MNCQICHKNQATVHVTDVESETHEEDGSVESTVGQERHVCSVCAQSLFRIAVSQTQPKVKVNIWKLLQVAKQKSTPSCPDCGMTLSEFRNKGRLGCPKDYEHFWPHIAPLLDRVHNATSHLQPDPEPVDEATQHLLDLRAKLQVAIMEEAYEDAAELRDAIEELEKSKSSSGTSE